MPKQRQSTSAQDLFDTLLVRILERDGTPFIKGVSLVAACTEAVLDCPEYVSLNDVENFNAHEWIEAATLRGVLVRVRYEETQRMPDRLKSMYALASQVKIYR